MRPPLKHLAKISALLLLGVIVSFLISNPAFAQDDDEEQLLLQGAQIFAENCAVCHGEDGQGRIGATLAKNWPSIRPDLRVRDVIVRGIPGTLMPAWGIANGGPLTDQEIEALTFYILSWQDGGEIFIFPTPTASSRPALTPPPGVSGDPNQGALLYASNCAVCHGSNGEGRIGATLAKDWPSFRPDLRVKSVIEVGIEGTFMPGWSQEHGGPLTDQEINDITAYVLTWEGAETTEGTQVPAVGPLTGWPVWLIVIGVFILIVIAIIYYSRQKPSQD